MRATDARAWNPNFLIFNDSIIQESEGEARFLTRRAGDVGGELRRQLRSRPLWLLSLANLQLSPTQHEELLAFGWEVQGMTNPFLCRNTRSCTLENVDGTKSLLGIGDGVTRSFQLTKRRGIQNRAGQVEVIRFPNFRYPALQDFNCHDWEVLPELDVWKNGVQMFDGFDVSRETGLVTPDILPIVGEVWEATGGYYNLLVANQDSIPTKLDGTYFKITSNVTFAQPEGGEDAELQRMGLL